MQQVIYSLATLEDEKEKELWWSGDDECTSTQKLCVGVASLSAKATALLGPSGHKEEVEVEVMLKRCQAHDRACKARWEELSKSTQGISSNNTDPWLLMLLNMLTCARILLNSIIMRCATWNYKVPNYQTSEEYDGACSALAEIILHSAKVNEQQLCWAEEAQSSFAELDVQLQPGRDSSRCAINKWIEDNRNLWEEKPLVGLQPLAVIWSLECLNDDQKIAIDTQLQRIVGIRGALPLHDDRVCPRWIKYAARHPILLRRAHDLRPVFPNPQRILPRLVREILPQLPRDAFGTRKRMMTLYLNFRTKVSRGVKSETAFPNALTVL